MTLTAVWAPLTKINAYKKRMAGASRGCRPMEAILTCTTDPANVNETSPKTVGIDSIFAAHAGAEQQNCWSVRTAEEA